MDNLSNLKKELKTIKKNSKQPKCCQVLKIFGNHRP